MTTVDTRDGEIRELVDLATPSVDSEEARVRAKVFAALVGEDDVVAIPPAIGRFVLLERLGQGGMGVVWAARDPDLDRRIALKLLRDEREGMRPRLVREAQAMAKVNHPNVAAVYEVGTHGGHVYLAMELVEGETLRRWADVERRTWREALDVYVQAGRGLAAAHAIGLVHRDFKPDNAMLGADGRVRVLDFGLVADGSGIDAAKMATIQDDGTHRLTRTGALVGTPAYMAPEQFRNEPVDARADQFAFCVALHEAVYGVRPHVAETVAALVLAVQEGDIVVPRRRAPRWLYRALRRGLATDPARRYPDMHALVQALERGRTRRVGMWVAAGTVALAAGTVALTRPLLVPNRSASIRSAMQSVAPSSTSEPQRLPTARQITRLSEDVQISDLAISADGSSIAYWASVANDGWLTIAPTAGGSGVSTRRGSIEGVAGIFGFTTEGEAISLQRDEVGGIQMMATSAVDATQRRMHVVEGLPELSSSGSFPAWISRDGYSIAVVDVANKSVRLVEADDRSTNVGKIEGHVLQLTVSPDARRMAWAERFLDGEREPRIVIAKTDGSAQRELISGPELARPPYAAVVFADDDRLVYATYGQDTGLDTSQIWDQPLDAERVAALGERRLVEDTVPGTPYSMSASERGRHLVFVRRERLNGILMAAIHPDGSIGTPQPLTVDTTNEVLAGWTADSRGLLFHSWRDGTSAFYARALADGVVSKVFVSAGIAAKPLGLDGDAVLFLHQAPDGGTEPSILRVLPDGSQTLLGHLPSLPPIIGTSCTSGRCTVLETTKDGGTLRELSWSGAAPQELARFELQTGHTPLHWFVTPDANGGAILPWDDSVVLVSLDGKPTRRLAVSSEKGSKPALLQYAAWAPDGKTLFVTGMHIEGHQYALIRMELDGSYEVVHSELNRWMFGPEVAPDGRHLAFNTWTLSGEVWLIER